MHSLGEKLKSLPRKPGVYLFKDKNGAVIYIGKANSLRKRVSSYFNKTPDLKTSILISRLRDIDFIITGSELDALVLEDELIKKYKPKYNVAQRDDKAYPFLKLTVNEEWPRLILARRKENDGARYFGRFQGGMVRAVIRLIKKIFPIRWCKETPLRKREQPCLYFQVGSCSGPCIGKVSREEYQTMVLGITLLLEGKMEAAMEKLTKEMERASAAQDFERAGYFRDSSEQLMKMLEGKVNLQRVSSPHGLIETEELQKKLKLVNAPMRIECFDISNIQGTNIVGSMVSFVGGLPLKNDYRRFKIRSLGEKPNDVQAIYEVVRRRYGGNLAKKMELPDLILIDGGAAQVNFGEKALLGTSAEGRPIVGLAKKEELIYLPKGNPTIVGQGTVRLTFHSPALQLLQRIRDEAHRFAVTYHREKRGKALFR